MKRFLLLPLLSDEELVTPRKRARVNVDPACEILSSLSYFPMLVEKSPLVQPTEKMVLSVSKFPVHMRNIAGRDYFTKIASTVTDIYPHTSISPNQTAYMLYRIRAKENTMYTFGLVFKQQWFTNQFFPLDWWIPIVSIATTASNHFYSDILTHEDHNEAIYDMIANQIRLFYLAHCEQMFVDYLSKSWGNHLKHYPKYH